jgi:hypothetical protein
MLRRYSYIGIFRFESETARQLYVMLPMLCIESGPDKKKQKEILTQGTSLLYGKKYYAGTQYG